MAKHLHLEITDTTLTITRNTTAIDAEAALDGIYVLRTTIPRLRHWTPPPWWPPTKTSPTSNATSGS